MDPTRMVATSTRSINWCEKSQIPTLNHFDQGKKNLAPKLGRACIDWAVGSYNTCTYRMIELRSDLLSAVHKVLVQLSC